jgi:hypothetical protein
MNRRTFFITSAAALLSPRRLRLTTSVTIRGEQFFINGRPTYTGRSYQGKRLEGLLMNARMVQATFDDENPETVALWRYPDTGRWDAERNTREFIAAMPSWKQHGLLSFVVCLQGGNPRGYQPDQPWRNNAFRPDGSLKPAHLERLEKVLDRADELGMVPMVCPFYFGQDQHFNGEAAIRAGLRNLLAWLTERGYRNVLVEIANECDNRKYDYPIFSPSRVVELFEVARKFNRRGPPFPLGVSLTGGKLPTPQIVAASDYLLLHGNGVKEPERIAEMVRATRKLAGYRPMPILFNEDDHFDFDQPVNNMLAAVGEYASWGLLDIGEGNYRDGYQSVPVNWGASSERKLEFFELLKRVTGGTA